MSTKEQLEKLLLETLLASESIDDTGKWCSLHSLDHNVMTGVLFSLAAASMVCFDTISKELTVPSEEGFDALKNGAPEARIFNAVKENPKAQSELLKEFGASGKVGFANAMKKKWISVQNGQVLAAVESIVDEVQELLKKVSDGKEISPDAFKELKKRKLVNKQTVKTYSVAKGPQFALERQESITELTQEMLKNKDWKDKMIKPLNLQSKGKDLAFGSLHPLLKVRAQYRSILLEMGFEEMPTNNFVESSFWNFDSLFQPQQHPARDAHDTFFVSSPGISKDIPLDYLQRVKDMHEKGGNGSLGWRYDWKESEARKNLLRTHTTAVSARMLYQLAQQKEFTPKKYFSIDRVFRNESVDATHLAEFNQIEGLVADRNLTLGDLLGTIKLFFERIGISNVKFKPAYNPYTEPSMEIFGFSEELGKWIEIGNSGIFRPEMLLPMGLPEDVRVIAWGLSLERPTMITYKYGDIRDLSGHKVNIKMIQSAQLCRYD